MMIWLTWAAMSDLHDPSLSNPKGLNQSKGHDPGEQEYQSWFLLKTFNQVALRM